MVLRTAVNLAGALAVCLPAAAQAPDYQPAIPTGVTAMTAIAMDVLK